MNVQTETLKVYRLELNQEQISKLYTLASYAVCESSTGSTSANKRAYSRLRGFIEELESLLKRSGADYIYHLNDERQPEPKG